MDNKLKNKIENFNPNGIGLENGHFIGLPFDEDDANIVVLSVPWDVTVSYNDGTSTGASNILDASTQLDLYDPSVKEAWKMGIYLQPIINFWLEKNNLFRKKAKTYINFLENGGVLLQDESMKNSLDEINLACEEMNLWVEEKTSELLHSGKIAGVVGGDHSSPLGLIRALSRTHSNFGILHIDAHMDLRKAYEGFTYSHASIFNNALKIKTVSKLVQVGVRDFCEEEIQVIEESNGRVISFNNNALTKAKFEGANWADKCAEIIQHLPQEVYISFDVDGLKPELCPNTGTPVPGGLEFDEVVYLMEQVVESGRIIIGFDLCEVAGMGNDWDGNVGARLLYKLCNLSGKSQGLNTLK